MEDIIKRTYALLGENGWTIIRQEPSSYGLPAHIRERYPNLPFEWAEFATRSRACVNADKSAWFLSANDFEDQKKDAFRWNEFELISLQAAEEERDDVWKRAIMEFWNDHLPVYLSVAGEYEYYAIRIQDGVVVHGTEPEFEEASEVAPSFARFLEMICTGKIVLN